MRVARAVVVLAALAAAGEARAHEVTHEVQRRGAVVAVRARHPGGGPLAGAWYQVVRPGAGDRVFREGRTDAQGWVEFVPDVPGRWRVRIADATGHGAVVKVDVAEVAPASARPASGSP
jgi:hypothetical protein